MRVLLLVLLYTNFCLVGAKALLAVFESHVVEGRSYPVEWLSDSEDYLTLQIVQQTAFGWNYVQGLFTNRTSNEPGGSYQWVVGENLTAGRSVKHDILPIVPDFGSGYGLYLLSTPVNNSTDDSGYADLTDWFDVSPANGPPLVSESFSPATTTSATSSTSGISQTPTSTQQSVATNATLSMQDSGLEEGTIVGIAVGCSVGAIVLLAAIVFTVFRHRRNRHETRSIQAVSPSNQPDDVAKPPIVTLDKSAELAEDSRTERAEMFAQTSHPFEKEAGYALANQPLEKDAGYAHEKTNQPLEKNAGYHPEEKKTILPLKPIEIG